MSGRDRQAQREYIRQWNTDWKNAAHSALGGVCARCGFEDSRALQIDHVNGDGALETRPSTSAGRRQRTGGSGSYYRRVAQNAPAGRYQLLCANCNWIKRHENGEQMARLV